MSSERPWEALRPGEKIERLRRDVGSFVEHSNEQAMRRNAAFDSLYERLKKVEETLKQVEIRLKKLKRENAL
jgi:hypothetical protein